MYYELSKSEKKIARAAIDKGLDAEFREGLEKSESVINEWRQEKFSSNNEAYHKLYKTIDEKDNAISIRYDGLGGSRYLITVAAILHDGYITQEDIAGFSDKTKEVINGLLSLWENKK
jgi:hypothetical protein